MSAIVPFPASAAGPRRDHSLDEAQRLLYEALALWEMAPQQCSIAYMCMVADAWRRFEAAQARVIMPRTVE